MAFVRKENYIANNGAVYADVDAWNDEHGPTCMDGQEDHGYTAIHQLLEGGTGIQAILTYADQAAHDAHMAIIVSNNPGVNTSGSWQSGANATGTFVSAE